MPNVTTCSRCGKTPAHRVEISLAMWNVADAFNPTASILGAEACEADQEAVIKTLFDHVVEMLREQAPLHKRAIELSEKRDRADRALRTFTPVIEAAARKAAASAADRSSDQPPKTADEFLEAEHRARIIELRDEIDAHESERVSVITQATDASDALQARLDKALKKKK